MPEHYVVKNMNLLLLIRLGIVNIMFHTGPSYQHSNSRSDEAHTSPQGLVQEHDTTALRNNIVVAAAIDANLSRRLIAMTIYGGNRYFLLSGTNTTSIKVYNA